MPICIGIGVRLKDIQVWSMTIIQRYQPSHISYFKDASSLPCVAALIELGLSTTSL